MILEGIEEWKPQGCKKHVVCGGDHDNQSSKFQNRAAAQDPALANGKFETWTYIQEQTFEARTGGVRI